MSKGKILKIHRSQRFLPKLFDDESVPTQTIEGGFVGTGLYVVNQNAEKKLIQIQEIFQQTDDQPAAKKILVEGHGKTTTFYGMVPHLWAKGDLFQEFDYVFKMKLKLLLSSNWQASYSGLIQDYPLACFVHYSLTQSIDKKLVSAADRVHMDEVREILESYDQTKILFLPDGYDEIAHLADQPGMIKDIIDELLGLQDAYVIMTSRPNALTTLLANEFRKVELDKLIGNGIELFIEQYFLEQHNALKDTVDEFFKTASATEEGLLHYLRSSTDSLKLEHYIQLKRIKSFILLKTEEAQEEFGISLYSLDTHENIKIAIDSYYHETKVSLIALLDTPSVQELASNPMNAAMLCLVCSDPAVLMKFNQEFTICELYKEVIVLMGKRFISKSLLDDYGRKIRFTDITPEKVLDLKQLKILQEIAYEAFKHGNLISGQFIDTKSTFSIRDLYEFGLLRVANHIKGDSDNLVDQEHSFIHISFQEYLAACALTEKLMSLDEVVYKEAAEFIAYHRNEPQYLMLLKFAAGMLSKLPDENKIAITRFWEAVECNINGILELGVERKVILLMHLVQQTKIHGHVDHRIANKETVIDFIDEVILKDFNQWIEAIKTSGYLSPRMIEFLWDVLENKVFVGISDLSTETKKPILYRAETSSDAMFTSKAIIEMVGSFLLDEFDNLRLLQILSQNLRYDVHWQIAKSSINIITKIVANPKNILEQEKTNSIIKQLIALVENRNLRESIINALEVFINIHQDNQVAIKIIFSSLVSLLTKGVNDPALYQLIYQIILTNDDEMLNFALDLFMPIISEPAVYCQTEIMSAEDSLDYNDDIHNSVIEIIEKVIRAGKEHMASLAIERLIPLLKDDRTRDNASLAIGKILVISEAETQRSVFDLLMSSLSDESSQYNVIASINSVLRTGTKISDEFSSRILIELLKLLDHPSIINKNPIIIAIGKVATTDLELKKTTLISLAKFTDQYPRAYHTIAVIALSGTEEILQQALAIFLSSLDRDAEDITNIEIPMNILTSGEISAEIATIILTRLMPLLESGNNQVIVSIANIAAKGYLSTEQITLFIKNIIKFINSDNINEEMLNSIYLASKTNPTLKSIFIVGLIDYLESINSEEISLDHYPIKSNIVKLIGQLHDGIDSHDIDRTLDLFLSMLTKLECDGDILAEAIRNITTDRDPNDLILSHLIPILSSENSAIVIITINTIVKIIEKQVITSETANLLLQNMVAHLLHTENCSSSVYAISQILQTGVVTDQISSEALAYMMSCLEYTSLKALHAAHIIGEIAEKVQIDDATLVQILEKLRSSILLEETAEETYTIIDKIIRATSFKGITPLIKLKDSNIRQIAVKALTDKLITSLTTGQISDSWEESIVLMLTIIGNDIADNYVGSDTGIVSIRKLYDVSRKILQHQVKLMDTEEVNLKWIVDNFDNLISISRSETKIMMVSIFYNALSDGRITPIESQFISLCITKLNFTITISIPPTKSNTVEFSIQFASKIYRLIGEENRQCIEDIANTVLETSTDLLARQYTQHKAIFKNTATGIDIAAIDVEECKSIVDGELITGNKYQVSFIYESDHLQSPPNNAFILCLRRESGYLSAEKIYVSGRTGQIAVAHYKQHPNALDSEFRQEIFGQMEYSSTAKVRDYAITFELSPLEGKELIDHAQEATDQRAAFALSRSSIRSNHWGLSDLIPHRHHSSSSPKKAYSNPKEIIEKLIALMRRTIEIEGLTGNWEEDQTGLTELKRSELILVDREDSLKIDLVPLINRQTLKRKALKEITIIEKDPEKKAFYFDFILLIESFRTATSGIYSKMLENKSHGITGTLGSLLSGVSAHIPFAGAVADFLGQILQGIDAIEQEARVERFVRFTRDSVLMTKIIEKVARKLALLELKIVEKESSMLATVLETANDALSAGIAGNVVAIGQNIKERVDAIAEEKDENPVTSVQDYATRFIQGTSDDTPQKRGAKNGAIVARLIVEKIFLGNYQEALHVNEEEEKNTKVFMLIEYVKSEYLPSSSAAQGGEIELDHIDTGLPSKDIKAGCFGDQSCIIMRVEIPDINPFAYPELQGMFGLPREQRRETFKKLTADEEPSSVPTNFFFQSEEGRDFLKNVEALYGREALAQMLNLGENKEFTEQILLEIKELGVEQILDTFFGANLNDAIANFERITEDNAGDRTGFYQHIWNALSDNHFTTFAQKLIKKIDHLHGMLERWLDNGESGNKIAIVASLLEFLIDHAASGQQVVRAGFRPSHYDPNDDGYGPGGGGSGSSTNGEKSENSTSSNYQSYDTMFFSGLNFTVLGNNHSTTESDH